MRTSLMIRPEVPTRGGRWFGFFLLFALCLPPLGAQESFEIEEVMSAPFPEGMVSAPKAGVLAWVYNHQGVRNIWVRTAAGGGVRQLTSYREDDGQAISGLLKGSTNQPMHMTETMAKPV